MRFMGHVTKAGWYWAVEVPSLGVYTQGKSKADAYSMVAEALELTIDKPGFRARVIPGKGTDFEITGNDSGALVALLLRQRRLSSGLSLAQVAKRLGLRSRTAYARYEQGRAVPTVSKLAELLKAVAPGDDFVFSPVGRQRARAA